MTDFYSYFEIRARVADRVGAVSPEVALAEPPSAFGLLDRLRAPHGAFPHVVSLAVDPSRMRSVWLSVTPELVRCVRATVRIQIGRAHV